MCSDMFLLSLMISSFDEGPLFETLEFFAINDGNYQPLNFLRNEILAY